MSIALQERRFVRYGLAASLSFAALALFIIWRFPPELYSFYTACPIHEYLHLRCPGCGTTRAISALLHGNLLEALHLNALFVLTVLPLSVIFVAAAIRRAIRGEALRWPTVPRSATYAALTIAAIFTILRNT